MPSSFPLSSVSEGSMVVTKYHLENVNKGPLKRVQLLSHLAGISVSSDIPYVHSAISLLATAEESKECPVCHRHFMHNHAMNKHLKCHDKSSSFGCNCCGKVLVDLPGLRTHMLTHADPAFKFASNT